MALCYAVHVARRLCNVFDTVIIATWLITVLVWLQLGCASLYIPGQFFCRKGLMNETIGQHFQCACFVCCIPPYVFAVNLVTFCDGSTDRCVNRRRGCVPVRLCYLQPLLFPPLFSLNNGTFHPLSSVKHIANSRQNLTSASFCVLLDAFETTEEVQIRMMAMASPNINPVVLHANQGACDYLKCRHILW